VDVLLAFKRSKIFKEDRRRVAFIEGYESTGSGESLTKDLFFYGLFMFFGWVEATDFHFMPNFLDNTSYRNTAKKH
jgi:hypothetical protein